MATSTRERQTDETTERDQSRERVNDGQVSAWEWLVAGIGLILVLGTIGFTLYRAIAMGEAPPRIAFTVDTIEPVGDGFLVRFTATNEGDEPAADLVIQGQLASDDGASETSTATLSYVPGHSQAEGGLYFTADPRTHRLVLRPLGYERP